MHYAPERVAAFAGQVEDDGWIDVTAAGSHDEPLQGCGHQGREGHQQCGGPEGHEQQAEPGAPGGHAIHLVCNQAARHVHDDAALVNAPCAEHGNDGRVVGVVAPVSVVDVGLDGLADHLQDFRFVHLRAAPRRVAVVENAPVGSHHHGVVDPIVVAGRFLHLRVEADEVFLGDAGLQRAFELDLEAGGDGQRPRLDGRHILLAEEVGVDGEHGPRREQHGAGGDEDDAGL